MTIPGVAAVIISVGERVTSASLRAPSGSTDLARPKSNTFTWPSGACLPISTSRSPGDDALIAHALQPDRVVAPREWIEPLPRSPREAV